MVSFLGLSFGPLLIFSLSSILLRLLGPAAKVGRATRFRASDEAPLGRAFAKRIFRVIDSPRRRTG
jgi:hypothetical protein